MKRTTKPKEVPPPCQYKRGEPRLRELVNVGVLFTETRGGFNMVLTRVPCIGEEIAHPEGLFRVVSVEHQQLDNYGWSEFGNHAIVEVESVPDLTWNERNGKPPPKKPRFRRPRSS